MNTPDQEDWGPGIAIDINIAHTSMEGNFNQLNNNIHETQSLK